MERWAKEPADDLKGGVSGFWFWLWVPRSASSLCDRLDGLDSDAGPVVSGEHMFTLRSLGLDDAWEYREEDADGRDVRVSKEGEEPKKGQPGQVQP